MGPVLGLCDTTDFFRSEHISEEDEGEKKISFVMMHRVSTRDWGRLHLLLACSAIPTRQLQSWQLNQEGCVGESPRDGSLRMLIKCAQPGEPTWKKRLRG